MKKIISVLLLFVLITMSFSGCIKDEFKEVASVTFTIDGKTQTRTSHAYMSIGKSQTISEEEYESADAKYKIDHAINGDLVEFLKPTKRTVSNIDGFTNSDKGKYLYYRFIVWGTLGFGAIRGQDFELGFCKYEITSTICYTYIMVKVVDDDTIIIRDSNGDTTYNVSSYRITYFE